MDIYNVFVQGDPVEEVYMDCPQELSNRVERGTNLLCILLKSLYRLKHASGQWNIKLMAALLLRGYQESLHDYLLFTKRHGNEIVIILVYVDDLRITENTSSLINEFKGTFKNSFKMKDVGDLTYFLGI